MQKVRTSLKNFCSKIGRELFRLRVWAMQHFVEFFADIFFSLSKGKKEKRISHLSTSKAIGKLIEFSSNCLRT
jgi:hypothetical protein